MNKKLYSKLIFVTGSIFVNSLLTQADVLPKPSFTENERDQKIFSISQSPEIVSSNLNIGLSYSLSSVYTKLKPQKSYLILVSQHPRKVLDFRTADLLHKSLLSDHGQYMEDVGHNIYGWVCRNSSSEKTVSGTGSQTGERNNQTLTMIKAGFGASSIFSIFKDGVFYNSELNEKRLSQLLNGTTSVKNRPNSFVLIKEVSENDCLNTLEWTKKFTEKNQGFETYYPFTRFGLNLDPRKLEGGGCGSTATAALSAGHFFSTDQSIENLFWRYLQFSNSVFGHQDLSKVNFITEINDMTDETFNEANIIVRRQLQLYQNKYIKPFTSIPMKNLITMNWDITDKNDPKNKTLKLVDPEMINLYFITLSESLFRLSKSKQLKDQNNIKNLIKKIKRKVVSVEYKYMDYEPKFDFQRYTRHYDLYKINKTYDPQAAELVKLTELHAQKLVEENKQFEFFQWGPNPALLIENE